MRWMVSMGVAMMVVGAAAMGLSACDDDTAANGAQPVPTDPGATPPDPGTAAEPTPSPGNPTPAVAGAVVDDPTFELRATAAGPYQNGELGQLEISLTPRGEYHVNEEFPIAVTLTAPAGLSLPKTELERSDCAEFGERKARFEIPFTPTATGEHRLEAMVSFAVCTPENCVPDERTLALVVPVQ